MATWREKEKAIRLLERNGKIDPNDLIEAARADDHPCHDDFTWDVNQAARERWRDQARELIRKVNFEVVYEDVTERVVYYVPNDGDEHKFDSLPRVRSKGKAGDIMFKELAMLHGLASRVYGIALAKQNLIGTAAVDKLRAVRDLVAELKADFSDEE